MNYRRAVSTLMLLLAVWFPLDNALAAAVVEGCPMMSHAFERGLSSTFHPAHSPQGGAAHCAQVTSAAPSSSSAPVLYHCVNGCEHCSLCLLFGTVALQLSAVNVPVSHAPSQNILSSSSTPVASVAAPLFRPPII